MELGRAYVQKGNTEEARKTFTEIVEKHADSPYLGRRSHRARKPEGLTFTICTEMPIGRRCGSG